MINAAEAYTYDGQNNLTSLWGSQYSTSTYTYDANGDRLTKLNQTHTTQYYFYDTNLLFTKRDGQIDVRYLYDDGAVYCAIYNDDIPYWYNTDIRGSVTNILKGDATSSITTTLNKSYVYDAYGNTDVTSTTEFRNAVAYTGAIFDQETGLYYLMSRYYDPALAQFISEDSYRGDGEHFWNLYMYCEGDPVNNVDRDGKKTLSITKNMSDDFTCLTLGGLNLLPTVFSIKVKMRLKAKILSRKQCVLKYLYVKYQIRREIFQHETYRAFWMNNIEIYNNKRKIVAKINANSYDKTATYFDSYNRNWCTDIREYKNLSKTIYRKGSVYISFTFKFYPAADCITYLWPYPGFDFNINL